MIVVFLRRKLTWLNFAETSIDGRSFGAFYDVEQKPNELVSVLLIASSSRGEGGGRRANEMRLALSVNTA